MKLGAPQANPVQSVQEFLRASHFDERLTRFTYETLISRALQDAGFALVRMKRLGDLGMTIATGRSSVAEEARHPTALVRRVVNRFRAEGLETDADYVTFHATVNGKIVLTVGVREPPAAC